MHLAGPIPVIVPGVLARRMADRLVAVAPLLQAAVDVVLIGVDQTPLGDRRLDQGPIVACLTFSSIRITTAPPRCNIPKIGGFSLAKVPRPRSPFRRLRRGGLPFFLYSARRGLGQIAVFCASA